MYNDVDVYSEVYLRDIWDVDRDDLSWMFMWP